MNSEKIKKILTTRVAIFVECTAAIAIVVNLTLTYSNMKTSIEKNTLNFKSLEKKLINQNKQIEKDLNTIKNNYNKSNIAMKALLLNLKYQNQIRIGSEVKFPDNIEHQLSISTIDLTSFNGEKNTIKANEAVVTSDMVNAISYNYDELKKEPLLFYENTMKELRLNKSEGAVLSNFMLEVIEK